jgi:hypothetical protein
MEITSNAQVSGEAKLVIEVIPSPFILFGKAGGSRLEVAQVDGEAAFASTGTV